jgi:mono/diheme cytochrome c family protein
MHPNTHSKSNANRLFKKLMIIACFGLLGIACNNGSGGSDSSEQKRQADATPRPTSEVALNTAGTAATPISDGSLPPRVVPTNPAGPIGQSTQTAQANPQGERQEIRGNIPVTVGPAKPAMTPAADPFPARPTPSVVMAEGKIVQQWQAPADAAKLGNPMKGRPDSANLGRELYMQKCNDCHGKEGKGNGWMGPSLKRGGKLLPPTNLASEVVQANTDGELFWKITNGRSPMPAHRVRFDDEQRWHIVSFLRTLKP